MSDYLRIQAPGVPTILQFEVDSVEYGDTQLPTSQRKIVGIKSGQPVKGSEFVVSSILGWWMEGRDEHSANRYLRVQTPGNPQILKFEIDHIEFNPSNAPDSDKNIRGIRGERVVAEFNIPSVLGWWLENPASKYLRVQAAGNPVILRIPVDRIEVTGGDPRDQDVKAIQNDKVIASFNVPSILGWWLEDEESADQVTQTSKHLFIQAPDNPLPYLQIDVDDVRVSDAGAPANERDVIGYRMGEIVARFNIPQLYRFWKNF